MKKFDTFEELQLFLVRKSNESLKLELKELKEKFTAYFEAAEFRNIDSIFDADFEHLQALGKYMADSTKEIANTARLSDIRCVELESQLDLVKSKEVNNIVKAALELSESYGKGHPRVSDSIWEIQEDIDLDIAVQSYLELL